MIRDVAHFLAVAAGYWTRADSGDCCAHVARYYMQAASDAEALA